MPVGPELFILAYILLPEQPTVHYHHAGTTRALYISLYSQHKELWSYLHDGNELLVVQEGEYKPI